MYFLFLVCVNMMPRLTQTEDDKQRTSASSFISALWALKSQQVAFSSLPRRVVASWLRLKLMLRFTVAALLKLRA